MDLVDFKCQFLMLKSTNIIVAHVEIYHYVKKPVKNSCSTQRSFQLKCRSRKTINILLINCVHFLITIGRG